jgi:ubiquinone/menaquinone biosynthesis C-methylase UbiE
MDLNPRLYNLVIDSLLIKIRERVSRHIIAQSKVIDIACGTGAQSFYLAKKCNNITGVDIWEPMINYAEKKRRKLNISNLTFKVADATDLSQFKDKEFDFSIMSLALHQFPPIDRIHILQEAVRISKKMIIADYTSPLPTNIYGWGIRFAERMAGKEHFANFNSYLSVGGLSGISKEIGLRTIHLEVFGNEVFVLGIL